MHDKDMGPTRTGFTEAYAQSLKANCALDLWPSNIVLVGDTSSNELLIWFMFLYFVYVALCKKSGVLLIGAD